jgi:hypothetical protein
MGQSICHVAVDWLEVIQLCKWVGVNKVSRLWHGEIWISVDSAQKEFSFSSVY